MKHTGYDHHTILIGSVLKPCDDVRTCNKIANTLLKTKPRQIYSAGYAPTHTSNHKRISFITLFDKKRLHWKRLLVPITFFLVLLRKKPNLLIVNTHELLVAGVLYKLFFGGCFIYDVRENYSKNILHTSVFPRLLRLPLAWYVRFKEWIASFFCSGYLLAERCYEPELPFIKSKTNYLILENKSSLSKKPVPQRRITENAPLFLFSGTIDFNYGIAEALDYFKQTQHYFPDAQLIIAGYAQQSDVQKWLYQQQRRIPGIQLYGINKPLSSSAIQEWIRKCHFGFIFHHKNKSYTHRIPTKLYDYLVAELPVISFDYPGVVPFIKQYNAGIISTIPVLTPEMAESLKAYQFYDTIHDKKDLLWTSEAEKIIPFLKQCCKTILY